MREPINWWEDLELKNLHSQKKKELNKKIRKLFKEKYGRESGEEPEESP